MKNKIFKGPGKTFVVRRTLRFTNIDGKFVNKSFGEIEEFVINQYRGQHYLTFKSNWFVPAWPDTVRQHNTL